MKVPKKKVFLCGGSTGGPIIPLVAISHNINYTPIIVGDLNGIEYKISQKNDYLFLGLPVSKLRILTFDKQNMWSVIGGAWDSLVSIVLLKIAIIQSIYYLTRHRPGLIISAGGFSAVPVILAARILNYFRRNKIKIAVHQQDPKVGLSNRISSRFADVLSCTFQYSRENYKEFADALLIPNPLDYSKFDQKINNKDLKNFVQKSEKPILLVFGGGSGSQKINEWVLDNKKKLTQKFSIIHLTGSLQTKKFLSQNQKDYLSLEYLDDDMGPVMKDSELVICRAGLGSITELRFLQKPAFLVPIANSHQELNAKLVKNSFGILEEKNMSKWVKNVIAYRDELASKKFEDDNQTVTQLNEYYNLLDSLDKKK